MKTSPQMIFSREAIPFLLDVFNYSIDEEKYIFNNELNCRALTIKGEEITLEELGGMMHGPDNSMLFFKKEPVKKRTNYCFKKIAALAKQINLKRSSRPKEKA